MAGFAFKPGVSMQENFKITVDFGAIPGPAAVLGGGPSLVDDLARLPANCTLISVNDHALHHCQPHVLVHMDNRFDEFPALGQAIREFRGIIVSPFENSDISLPKGWWDGGFSSTLATWFALWQGFEPVILCGMDCYQGDVKYCHPRPGFHHPVFDSPLENHLRAWRLAFKKCPNPERIRAMSGPLVEVFGAYGQ
jgi:hypothetical protein